MHRLKFCVATIELGFSQTSISLFVPIYQLKVFQAIHSLHTIDLQQINILQVQKTSISVNNAIKAHYFVSVDLIPRKASKYLLIDQ